MSENLHTEPLRVLLVEDNEHDHRAFERAFAKQDPSAEIFHVHRAEEALEHIFEDGADFDIVVSDFSMPGVSGVDLCRELIDRRARVPLVILTGTGSERIAVEALKAGAYDYILKDPDGGYLELLPLVVREVVQRHADRQSRERTEAALRESEERFKDFAEAASDWLWEMDADLRFTFFSDRRRELISLPADENIGKTRWELADADPDEDVKWGAHRATMEAHEPFRDFEFDHLAADGRRLHMNVGGKPVFDQAGNFTGYRGTATDITARKNAEEALITAKLVAESASRAKSEFLAAISHDLRTPLNAILGFAEILSSEYMGPIGAAKYLEYARDIHASGSHLLALVNDILDLSTIEAGKLALAKENLPVEEVVADCLKTVSRSAEEKHIDLEFDPEESTANVYADGRALQQILLNLLSNAVKFTPKAGRILLSAKAEAGSTIFGIADSGVGIPAEKIPDLTDPFMKGGNSAYLSEEGWGLGLAITQSLVDLHGGMMKIESVVDQGTTVTVSFPNKPD